MISEPPKEPEKPKAPSRLNSIRKESSLKMVNSPKAIRRTKEPTLTFAQSKNPSAVSFSTTPLANESMILQLSKSTLFAKPSLSIESEPSEFRAFHDDQVHPMQILDVGPQSPLTETIFGNLAKDVTRTLLDLELSIEDLMKWKDDMMQKSMPADVKLDLSMLFSRLFRSKSDLHAPLFELLKQVRMYGKPWNVNREKMLNLEKAFHRNYFVLDVAIRKLEAMQKRFNAQKVKHQLLLWERLATRVLHHRKGGDLVIAAPNIHTPNVMRRSSNVPPAIATSAATTPWKDDYDPIIKPKTPKFKAVAVKPVNSEWENLKKAIKAEIVDESEETKQCRQIIKAFKILLSKQHLAIHHTIKKLLKWPFRKNNNMDYITKHAGTVRCREPKLPLVRSLSYPDLRQFEKDSVKMKAFKKWHKEQYESKELNENGVVEEKEVDYISNPFLKHARRNSYHCVYDLGKSPLVTASFDFENEMPGKVTIEDADDKCSVSSNSSKAESTYSNVDQKLFQAFLKNNNVQENINRFLNSRAKTNESEMPTDGMEFEVDVEKEKFDFQEVMELTLLHARQLQMVQAEFAAREEELQARLREMEAQKNDEIEDWKNKYLQAGSGRNDEVYSAMESSTISSRVPVATIREEEHMVSTSKHDLYEKTKIKRSQSFTLAQSNTDIRMVNLHSRSISETPAARVEQFSKPEPEKQFSPIASMPSIGQIKRSKRSINYVQNIKMEEFSSTPFKLNFFKRLEWFAKMSAREHEFQRQKYTNLEKELNEKRLASLSLLESSANVELPHLPMKAQFMPAPGQVPAKKDAFQNSKFGLWGGRYKVTAAKAKRLHVLNLFDVSLDIPEEQRSSEDED